MATKEEILDIIDFETGAKTGQTVLRSMAHERGIAHKAIHLWLMHEGEEGPEFYLQRRSLIKPNFPGIFVASVGGHVLSGEGVESMVREAQEEIGYTLDPEEARFVDYHPFELILPHYVDHEWIEEYVVLTDWGLEDFTFEDGEVIGMAAITQKDMARLVLGETEEVTGRYFDGERTRTRSFRKEDFITDFLQMEISKKLVQLKLDEV